MPLWGKVVIAVIVVAAFVALAVFAIQGFREDRAAAAAAGVDPVLAESETQSISTWFPRHLEDVTVAVATRGRHALEDHEQPWMAGRPAVGRVPVAPAREIEVRPVPAMEAVGTVRSLLRRNRGRS